MPERQATIAGHDHFQQVARTAFADPVKSPKQNQPGAEPADRRREQALPPIERFGDLHEIALMPERDLLERVDAKMKDEVDEAANDADACREQQMDRFLTEPQLFPDAQQLLPVPPEKILHLRQDLSPTLRPGSHLMIL